MSKRRLKIAALNLMPAKKITEEHLKSVLTDAGAVYDLTLLTTASYQSKNTDAAYLQANYKKLADVRDDFFDIFIITGAPVEHLNFEEVAYWHELEEVLVFTRDNCLFNIFICWAAQAALYKFYGVGKEALPQKYFGVFKQDIKNSKSVFYKGFSGPFLMPHSRHTTLNNKVTGIKELNIEAACGCEISVLSSSDLRDLFITGHPEYSAETLHFEYKRDLEKGKKINKPFNYYPRDDENAVPLNTWRGGAVKFYRNIVEHVNILKQMQEIKYENI
jgi:homoserine O-succinyltransferase